MMNYIKPPLGAIPKEIWDWKRLEHLKDTICRFISVNKEIPTEWTDEYNELTNKLN